MLTPGQSIDVAGHIRIRQCRHGPTMYFTTDRYVGRSLDLYGEFSELESHILAQVIKPGMKVIEVGANMGAHTVAMSRMVGPGGYVIAVEPQAELFKVLSANLAMNAASNVWPECAAAGAESGDILMPAVDYSQPGNFGGVSAGAGARSVRVMTLDSIWRKVTGFHVLKIDVEGMELDVLRGAAAMLKNDRPVLYIENDRQDKSPALIRHLLELNYRCYWSLPPLFNPNNFFGHSTNVFDTLLSINMLCLPRENQTTMVGFVEITNPAAWWDRPPPP